MLAAATGKAQLPMADSLKDEGTEWQVIGSMCQTNTQETWVSSPTCCSPHHGEPVGQYGNLVLYSFGDPQPMQLSRVRTKEE